MDIGGVQDGIENLASKVAFICDFFSQPRRRECNPEFSDRGVTGLYLFIREIEETLEMYLTEIQKIRRQGVPS